MVCCAICDNYYCDKSKKAGVTFHVLPKEQNQRIKWLQVCSQRKYLDGKNLRVCSDHFSENDYERDLFSELLQVERRKKLKSDAVPHLKLDANVKRKRISKIPNSENKRSKTEDDKQHHTQHEDNFCTITKNYCKYWKL